MQNFKALYYDLMEKYDALTRENLRLKKIVAKWKQKTAALEVTNHSVAQKNQRRQSL